MVLEDQERLEEAADFLRALAHPVRLCIVRRLLGLIRGERSGLEVAYQLKDERVAKILRALLCGGDEEGAAHGDEEAATPCC